MMFNLGSNDVIACPSYAEDGEIVGLRAAAGEYNLSSAASEQFGDGLPRPLNRRPRVLSVMMNRLSIAKLLEIIRTHRLKHFGKKRSGRITVEVYPVHESIVGE